MLRLPGILALGNMIFGGSRRCRHGSFPGSLFLLPALMFGGWIAAAAVGGNPEPGLRRYRGRLLRPGIRRFGRIFGQRNYSRYCDRPGSLLFFP